MVGVIGCRLFLFWKREYINVPNSVQLELSPLLQCEVGIGAECDDCEKGFTVNGKPVNKEEFDNYVSQFKHDEKPTTTTSKESYFINGKSVDKSEFDKEFEKFEEKYLDNISDMLLSYSEFMDEINEWRSRFLRW